MFHQTLTLPSSTLPTLLPFVLALLVIDTITIIIIILRLFFIAQSEEKADSVERKKERKKERSWTPTQHQKNYTHTYIHIFNYLLTT